MPTLTILASVLLFAAAVVAQQVAPFLVTGSLDGCKADPGDAYNRGGTIKVNNFNIYVPENLIVQFPVVWAPFAELCDAKAEGFETTVAGNVIDGKVIAGQVQVAQRFGLEGSQGYIQSVNADGSLTILGGPKLRINDPDGLFGPPPANDDYKYWIADTGNPSVSSFSGVPMCIPYAGNTATCKTSNRLNGQRFTPPDQLSMVPFRAGDFIEYTGLTVGGEMLVSSIVTISLDIRTTGPQYIRVEEFLVGVPDTAGNVEVADIRAVGFLSKCQGATVFIEAIEVDPCTGKETYRRIGSASPRQEVRCKWELRTDSPVQSPFTREYRVTTSTSIQETTAGIQAGLFIQAVGEWIFPEVDVPGTIPPPYIFSEILGLAQGDFLDGKQFGQLNPYPETFAPPVPKICKSEDIPDPNAPPTPTPTPTPTPVPNQPPVKQFPPIVSIAGVTTVQRTGVFVQLTGTNTESRVLNTDLTYSWVQVSPAAPLAVINNKDFAKCNFLAPKPSTKTPFIFELTMTRKSDSKLFDKSQTLVTVDPTLPDTVTLDSYGFESKQGGTLLVSCSSNVQNGANTFMTVVVNTNGNAYPMAAVAGQPGKWALNRRSTARPQNLKCVSNLKGESVVRSGNTPFKRR